MRTVGCIVLSMVLTSTTWAQFTEVFRDDFDDGNIDGLVEFDIIGTILTQVTGEPTVFHQISFPDGGMRLTAPPTPDPAFGVSRSGIEQQQVRVTNFEISVDVVGMADHPNNTFGVSARTDAQGPGAIDGYFLFGTKAGPMGSNEFALIIDRLDGEAITVLGATEVLTLDTTKDYRVTFRGVGEQLTGQIFDFADLTNPIASVTAADGTYASGFTGLTSSGGGPVDSPDFSSFGDVTFDNYVVSIPEPSASSLLLFGILGAMGLGRRLR